MRAHMNISIACLLHARLITVQRHKPPFPNPQAGVDWDWWLYNEGVRRGLQAVVPEVSRTAHAGAAGAHVTGWEQRHYFDLRLINYRPHVQLRNVHRFALNSYCFLFVRQMFVLRKTPFWHVVRCGLFRLFFETFFNTITWMKETLKYP